MTAGPATPIFRIFDEDLAREFYVGFLEFEVEFEHRFEDDLPLYLGLRRGTCTLHRSGHFGDGTPGSKVRIPVNGLFDYAKMPSAKKYEHARPGLPGPTPWGTVELTIADPFGNKINFYEDLA